MIWATILAIVVFVSGLCIFLYKAGQNTASLESIREEVTRRQKQEEYAKKIKDNISGLTVDSVRGRLHKIKRK